MSRQQRWIGAAWILAAAMGCDFSVQAGSADAGVDGGGTDGGGNVTATSAVTISGYTLEPRSALMATSLIPAMGMPNRMTYVVVSDYDALCAGYTCSVSSLGLPAGTHLYFLLFGTGVKTYNVVASPASDGAVVSFVRAGPGGATIFSDVGNSGTVTVESYSETGYATGQYNVTMKNGSVIKGHFSTSYCKGITLNIPMGGVVCTETGDTASCQNPCTCEGKTVKAACTSTGTNMWSCNCTSVTGASTTCTMSGPQAVPANLTACWSYGTCCPMKF